MPIQFTCPHCGLQTNVPEEYAGQGGPCAGCGQRITIPPISRPAGPAPAFRPPPSIGDDPAIRMLLPVGRSGLAIAAGYAGLFAILLVPAPIALLLGILAIRDLRNNPHKHGMGRAIFGVVMGSVFTLALVFGLFGLIVAALKSGM
jgi:hypothetical protein